MVIGHSRPSDSTHYTLRDYTMDYVGQIEVKDKNCHMMVRAYHDGGVTRFTVLGTVVYRDRSYYPFKYKEVEIEVNDKYVCIPTHVFNQSLWGCSNTPQNRTAINSRLTALLTTEDMRKWFGNKRKKQD